MRSDFSITLSPTKLTPSSFASSTCLELRKRPWAVLLISRDGIVLLPLRVLSVGDLSDVVARVFRGSLYIETNVEVDSSVTSGSVVCSRAC